MPRPRLPVEALQHAQDTLSVIKAIRETQEQAQKLVASAVGFNRTVWSGPNHIQPFHEQWLNIADSGDSCQILAARDHFKTSVLTLNYPLYRIVKDPNVQIILVSESSSQAQKWTRKLMRDIETRYRWLDGSNLEHGKWTDRMFTVPRTSPSKDATVEAVGMLGRITGGHFDLAIVDDVVSMENTRSDIIREHVYEWFHHVLIPCMLPVSQILVVGSAWHYDDLYVKNEKEGWRTYKFPAILDFGQPTQRILFEERYTNEKLAQRRAEMGTPFFNCQFLLDPGGLVGRLLRREWLEPFITEKDVLPGDMERVTGVDLAFSEKTSADYTALVTLGYSPTTNLIYVLDVVREQVYFPDAIKLIDHTYDRQKPGRIIIESNAFANLLVIQPLLKDTLLPIVPRETIKDMTSRMLRISPYFETGRVKVKFSQTDLITEFVQFPDTQHDDILSALDLALTDIIGRHLSARGWSGSGGLVKQRGQWQWPTRSDAPK